MNFIESTKLPKIQSQSLWTLLASSYTIMLSDNEMVLPNIIISEGVLKWFTFSCGVGGGGLGALSPKSSGMAILENAAKGVFNMTPQQERGE